MVLGTIVLLPSIILINLYFIHIYKKYAGSEEKDEVQLANIEAVPVIQTTKRSEPEAEFLEIGYALPVNDEENAIGIPIDVSNP